MTSGRDKTGRPGVVLERSRAALEHKKFVRSPTMNGRRSCSCQRLRSPCSSGLPLDEAHDVRVVTKFAVVQLRDDNRVPGGLELGPRTLKNAMRLDH